MINYQEEHRTEKFLLIAFMLLSVILSASLLFGLTLSKGSEYPLAQLLGSSASAPSDFIKEKNIEIYSDRIIIKITNASLSEYAPTGSMRPLFDTGANGIRIVPNSPDEITLGDIITFEKGNTLIVHRVVEKGEDAIGVYFITKGDNNLISDGKVRFEDIKYKTIGILY